MKKNKRIITIVIVLATAFTGCGSAPVRHSRGTQKTQANNPNPPSKPVKLVFIHHSVGQNWLEEPGENSCGGGLGKALRDNNYFVSDTNYDWGPTDPDLGGPIGNFTDTGHWWNWFRGPHSSTHLNALYNESEQHSSYPRLSTNPGGENEIIMFKSCFPNSDITGDVNSSPPPISENPLRGNSGPLDAADCKGIYIDLLEYFKTRQDKLFVVITTPPMQTLQEPSTVRAFNNWLVNDWLDNYPYKNVFVFDFYNVLTTNGGNPDVNDAGSEGGNHHRWWNGAVQHKTDGGSDVLAYPSGESHDDNHPSSAGGQKATQEFVPLLNYAYNTWKGNQPPAPNFTSTWYTAEGSTGPGFETWILIQNPGNAEVLARLTYMTPSGSFPGGDVNLPPKTRCTVNLSETLPGEDSVSTRVQATGKIIVEKAMYINNRSAGHNSIGVTSPSKTWFLAEGSTYEGFETWILIQNPQSEAVTARLTFMTPYGEKEGPTINLPAGSRQTVNVSGTLPDEPNVSTKVEATAPVVVERSMYWNGRKGAHNSIGVTSPSNTWYLAEGSTYEGFETWILIQNPQSEAVTLKLTYMTPSGEREGPTLLIPSNSRQTVNVAGTLPNEPSVSTKIEASAPVIAERSMYWNGRIEGHNSIGVTSPSSTWYLAEGSTGGDFETWILVQNPQNDAVTAKLTFMTPSGEVEGPEFQLGGETRKSINLSEYLPDTWSVSTKITSRNVICERAMYWSGRIAGHDSIGVAQEKL